MNKFIRTASLICTLGLMVSLSACAEMPKSPEAQAEYKALDDPLEPMNRVVFDVNDFLDRLLIRPLAELYRNIIPPGLRDRIANGVDNMKQPVVFANNLLQGEGTSAGTTLSRFLVNTTVGVGGLFDVATDWGLPEQQGDFGQTLYTWGIKGGPYLVLPFFGPSNFRDAIGTGIDSVMSPWGYIAGIDGNGTANRVKFSSLAAEGMVKREQNIEALDALKSGSLDFYAQMRSVYRQYRDKQLGIDNPASHPVFDEN